MDLNRKQDGFIGGSGVALLVGGLALGGLLVYGALSGYELSLWPAIAVALVNLVAAAKIVLDTRKARQRQNPAADTGGSHARPDQ